jgi:hypothetical protein
MGIEFVELPPILVFALKRSIYNNLTGKREQINDFFSFTEDLDLTKFVSQRGLYELFAVFVHTGNSISGHHFAFIKINPGDQWYHFNDSVVSIASREQAVSQNFGGNTTTAAYMLVYTRKSMLGELFRPCELPVRMRDFVSDVQLRTPTGRGGQSQAIRKFNLITEEVIRRQILDDRKVSHLNDLPAVLEVDDGSSNHDLYSQIAVYCDRPSSMILLWKVDDKKMPTVIIPEGPQKCPRKDMFLFVQELIEPVINLPRGLHVAILTFFAQNATPRVQFIGSTTITPMQPILQVFPFAWSVLGIPKILFNVYCESYDLFKPIPHNYPLTDLGLIDSDVFLLEPIVPVQTRYQFAYFKPKQEGIVYYYSKVRPNGDMTAVEYLERKTPQIAIEVYRVCDPGTLVVTIKAPELMVVTELPGFVLFAAKEHFDVNRDTIQLFRQKPNEDTNELVPYGLKSDVNLRMMFVSDLKRGAGTPKLFYDIMKGMSAEQLKLMIVRTCEVYDAPCHKLRQVRWPMKVTDPLQNLIQYIQNEIYPCKNARLLIDVDGVVEPVDFSQQIATDVVLRFDVVPGDQRVLRPGEFLVVMVVCRYTKNQDNVIGLGKSFMFKVVPGELVEETRRRIGEYDFADQRLIPDVMFQVGGRVLNGDERIDQFARPNDVVRVVLPGIARTKCLLKKPLVERRIRED